MRYVVLVTDYDGTLAKHGAVKDAALNLLRRLRDSGRRLILVTGRELPDLLRVFPQYDIFHLIVAENGALVFNPATREEKLMGAPPPDAFIQHLKDQHVTPLSIGKVIVATWEPHQTTVLNAILEFGLELQVIFNKGAVMILPPGINKAVGLRAALKELGISSHNTVALGDAENDHALLEACELRVAVANALPTLKERADFTTLQPNGDGFIELGEQLLESDLQQLTDRVPRWNIELGNSGNQTLTLPPYGKRILVCGTSGSGKSTLASGVLERLSEKGYQFCLIDPEGDFEALNDTVLIGGPDQVPSVEEVIALLSSGDRSVVISLLGVPLESRPAAFVKLLARLSEHRAHFGTPHWIVADEAHHFMPAGAISLPDPILNAPTGLLLITVHPEHLAAPVLQMMNIIIVVGETPATALNVFADAHGVERVAIEDTPLQPGEAIYWRPEGKQLPVRFKTLPSQSQRRRHQRKYAAGLLGEDKSFYFRGPNDALNLRAHNLTLFIQIADGVDDETWLYHLRRQDYSKWLRDAVKDDALAQDVAAVENDAGVSAREGRERIKEAIVSRYTLPA